MLWPSEYVIFIYIAKSRSHPKPKGQSKQLLIIIEELILQVTYSIFNVTMSILNKQNCVFKMCILKYFCFCQVRHILESPADPQRGCPSFVSTRGRAGSSGRAWPTRRTSAWLPVPRTATWHRGTSPPPPLGPLRPRRTLFPKMM